MSLSKHSLRTLSLILSLSVAGMTPVSAAVDTQHAVKKDPVVAVKGDLPAKLPKTKVELPSKRTKYSTRYLNPDGSFSEEVYSQPVFYQDQNHQWKSIDNTLKASTSKSNTYQNAANDFQTEFPGQTGSGDLVTVSKNGQSLSLDPQQAKSVSGSVKGNQISYGDLFADTDATYQVESTGVKENLVLHKYDNQNTFSFALKTNGLKATVDKNGTITLVNAHGQPQWYFEKPFMTDAKGKRSDNVKLSLRTANGTTYVDVQADSNFLKDPKTAYPVTIDPTVSSWDVDRDNFVASAFPTSIYSSNSYFDVGQNSSYFGTTRSLVQFYLPSLPSSSTITSANFNAYQTNTDASNVSVDLFRATSNWSDNVTWNTQPTTGSTAESTVTSNASNAYWQWDITKLAKDWYSGAQANYGFLLKAENESTAPLQSFNSVTASNYTPRLTINYTVDPIGLETFWGYTKDHVNPANGNLVLQGADCGCNTQNDLVIPGRGVPVSESRIFNSRNASTAGLFGYGWSSNVEAHLIDSGLGPITYVDGDGTRHVYGQALSGGQYTNPPGVYLSLVKNADGTYTMTANDGTKTNFNTSGKLASVVDTNGNKTTYTYDANGKLTTITDASGRTTTLAYGTNGFVSSVTDPANRTMSYSYDANNNLTKVTDQNGSSTTYAYDSSHRVTGVTNARNITTNFTYDANNRVSTVAKPITTNGTATTGTSTYTYDTTNLVTTVTDGEGRRIDYTYNANGNVVQVAANPTDATTKSVTTYTYDDSNNLTQKTDPNGNAYLYTYDANGNRLSSELPDTHTTYNTFDSNNNLIQVQDYNGNIGTNNYDAENDPIEATDPNAQTVAQRYDANGNLQYSTTAMSAADNLLPNPSMENADSTGAWASHWKQDTQPGYTATYAWSTSSKFGNKAVSISNPTGWAILDSDTVPYVAGKSYTFGGYIKTSGVTSSAFIKVQYYDANGNWLDQKVSDFLTGTQDWTRVEQTIDNAPANTASVSIGLSMNPGSGTATFDGVQLVQSSSLPAFNLVENGGFERGTGTTPDSWTNSGNLSTGDGIDNTTSYIGQNSFKLTGQSGVNKYIKQHINFSGDSSTPLTLSGWSEQSGASTSGGNYELQVALNYTDGTVDWNNANNFSKVTGGWQHVAATVKPTKAFSSIDVYYYYYNQTGTAWFDSMRLENDANVTLDQYDANGNNLTSVVDPLSHTTSYAYDAVGNNTGITDANGNTTTFAYDGRNHVTQVTDANKGVTSYTYDGVGNVTQSTDAKSNKTTYTYNEYNLLSGITNPLNQTLSYGYDKVGNLTSATQPNGNKVTYTYDALNRMNSISYNGTQQWSLGYDPNGNVTSVTDSAGNATNYSYDVNNRLTKIAEGSANSTAMSYDANGNVTSENLTAGSATVASGYTYDKLNELTAVTRGGTTEAHYFYDERGNVIDVTHGNGTFSSYSYDGSNRLLTVKNYVKGNLVDSYSYTYDANNNVTAITGSNGNTSYKYDALNQLTQETLVDGTTIAYTYDAAGNRTSKAVTNNGNTTTTNYTYDAANELTAVGSQAYTYDPNGNLTGNGAKTFVYDANNQLTQVKDSSGNVLASFTYDNQGRRTKMTTSTATVIDHYNGNNEVAYETDGNNNILTDYTYDAQGNPVTMTKGSNTYYYHLDAHGDVTALSDSNGNIVAQYQYDAYGNITSQTGSMATSNPYRYAGYHYDDATGLYYLNARYYDASTGHFLTRDSYPYLGHVNQPQTFNLYAYVANNPLGATDPSGHKIFIKKVWGNPWLKGFSWGWKFANWLDCGRWAYECHAS